MIRIYETRVASPTHHPKLGRLEPDELWPLDEDVASSYCDREHEVPGDDGEMVVEPVEGILAEWAPESAAAIAKRRRPQLEAIAQTLGIRDPGDEEKYPNKVELAKAIFKALPKRSKPATE